MLRGAIAGLGLGSDAPDIFKALVDAAAFGARSIVERFLSEGLPIEEVFALGGIARRSPLVMQTLADVLNMTVRVSASEQTCALGAAMFAATVCGIYDDVTEAQQVMGKGFDVEYRPAPERVGLYRERYDQYARLGEVIEVWQKRPAGGWTDARD
jgi:L-ribulokinase